jgi:hypothetical protein
MSANGKARQRRLEQPESTHACHGHDHDPIATLLAPVPVAGIARAVEDGATHDELGGTAVEGGVDQAIRRRVGRGAALPTQVAGDLGAKLGADLSGVRVHADAESHTLARSVQAEAFTVGSDIFFSRGTFAPGTSKGRSLLAHELTHVRQHQRGGSSGGSGLTVGRSDDPAEREAETVSRQVMSGGAVAGAAAGAGPAGGVRRKLDASAPATVRRLFGKKKKLSATSAIGASTTGENLGAAIELANAIHTATKAGEGKNVGKTDGSALDGIDSFGEIASAKGTLAGVGAAYALKQGVEGAIGVGKGIKQMTHKHDFGASVGSTTQYSSIDRNSGAKQVEGGVLGLAASGGAATAAANQFVGLANSAIPFADTAYAGMQAGIKGKTAVEDSIASARLGHQRTKVKRDQDMLMDDATRGKRFGTFIASLRDANGTVKSDDRKRWKTFYDKWLEHAATLGATEYASTDSEADLATKNKKSFFSRFKRGGSATTDLPASPGAAPAATGPTTAPFDPLAAKWDDPSDQKAQKAEFLAFMKTTAGKDFGFGTGVREAFDEKTVADRAAAESNVRGRRVAESSYEQMRGLGKVAAFGQRRKGETATINAVEATGHALDAAGSFTAAGDMGATKAVGKGIGLLSGAYKGIKTLDKRRRRVSKLADAKNAAGYDGKSDRGFGWKLKTFLGGNVESSQTKTRDALGAAAVARKPLEDWEDRKDQFDAHTQWAAALDQAKANPAGGQTADEAEAEYRAANPEPVDTPDPGPAPTIDAMAGTVGAGGQVGKKVKTSLTQQQQDQQIKLLSNQLKRTMDDLVNAVFSEDPLIRARAWHIVHTIAESSLVGVATQISDKELEMLYQVSLKLKAETNSAAEFGEDGPHAKEFHRRRDALHELLSKQLEGVGG